jgi:hypothetical protein
LKKTSNLNFILRLYENRAKSQFYQVLFNEFHHRTKLMALLLSSFAF